MITLRNVWDASSEAEKDAPLLIFPSDLGPEKEFMMRWSEPVRSQTVLNDYVDGKQTHPAVLVLSDLRPEEVK